MYKFRFLFIVTTLILLVNCQKERTEPSAMSLKPLSYILTKQTFTTSLGNNGQWYEYFYNQDNLVEEIRRIQWGTQTIDGGESNTWQDTTYQIFEYANNLPVKCTVKNNSNTWYYEYEYTDGLITKKTVFYHDYSVQNYSFYRYDSQDRLIEAIDSTDKVNYRDTFEYNENNNVKTHTTFNMWDTPQKKKKFAFIDFDNKVNFSIAINGIPLVETFIMHSCVSQNNIVKEESYTYVDSQNEYDSPSIDSYYYEYNEEGLPLVRKIGGLTFTYEYEKFR
jgi:hypothetical protein